MFWVVVLSDPSTIHQTSSKLQAPSYFLKSLSLLVWVWCPYLRSARSKTPLHSKSGNKPRAIYVGSKMPSCLIDFPLCTGDVLERSHRAVHLGMTGSVNASQAKFSQRTTEARRRGMASLGRTHGLGSLKPKLEIGLGANIS